MSRHGKRSDSELRERVMTKFAQLISLGAEAPADALLLQSDRPMSRAELRRLEGSLAARIDLVRRGQKRSRGASGAKPPEIPPAIGRVSVIVVDRGRVNGGPWEYLVGDASVAPENGLPKRAGRPKAETWRDIVADNSIERKFRQGVRRISGGTRFEAEDLQWRLINIAAKLYQLSVCTSVRECLTLAIDGECAQISLRALYRRLGAVRMDWTPHPDDAKGKMLMAFRRALERRSRPRRREIAGHHLGSLPKRCPE